MSDGEIIETNRKFEENVAEKKFERNKIQLSESLESLLTLDSGVGTIGPSRTESLESLQFPEKTKRSGSDEIKQYSKNKIEPKLGQKLQHLTISAKKLPSSSKPNPQTRIGKYANNSCNSFSIK